MCKQEQKKQLNLDFLLLLTDHDLVYKFQRICLKGFYCAETKYGCRYIQTALQMDVQVKLNAPSGGINITFAILKKVDQIYLSK
jgi:hypothetical protein